MAYLIQIAVRQDYTSARLQANVHETLATGRDYIMQKCPVRVAVAGWPGSSTPLPTTPSELLAQVPLLAIWLPRSPLASEGGVPPEGRRTSQIRNDRELRHAWPTVTLDR